MTKLDLKKDLKHLYKPSANVISRVDVPPLHYLMLDGEGDPNTAPAFQAAMEALFAVAYAIKFMSKADPGIDYTVMPLEGLWWTDDMAQFSVSAKADWQWKVMIMQLDHITEDMVQQAIEKTRAKKNPPALDKLRFETYHEGLSAQIMYVGPFADEGPTIARLHAWIAENGYTHHGAKAHHEIYLSDMRRTAPEKLKTVIRQPMIETG
jgi:hypothetical protein